MLTWCSQCHLPTHILLNKADKLAPGAVKTTLLETRKAIENYPTVVTIQAFSAIKGTGLNELKVKLDEWYGTDVRRFNTQIQEG